MDLLMLNRWKRICCQPYPPPPSPPLSIVDSEKELKTARLGSSFKGQVPRIKYLPGSRMAKWRCNGSGCASLCPHKLWLGLGWALVKPMLTNYREAVAAKFPAETKARAWFPLRLSNFLPGHSAFLNQKFSFNTGSPTHKGCDCTLDINIWMHLQKEAGPVVTHSGEDVYMSLIICLNNLKNLD